MTTIAFDYLLIDEQTYLPTVGSSGLFIFHQKTPRRLSGKFLLTVLITWHIRELQVLELTVGIIRLRPLD